MIKKIIIILLLVFSFNSFVNAGLSWGEWWACGFDWDVWSSIESCLQWTKVSWTQASDLEIWEGDFKDSINAMIWKIAGALLLIAIWSIAYAWFMMVISAWEEEKIKKGKDIVKWSILGAFWIIIASSLIAITVNLIYSIAG